MVDTLIFLAQAPASPPANPSGGGVWDIMVIWGILLIALALVLFFVEIFVPSGGFIAIVGAVGLAAGIFLLFRVDTTLGLAGALITLATLPFLIGFGLKLFPDLPMAKFFILRSPGDKDVEGEEGEAPPQPEGHDDHTMSVGTVGKAMTDLRPVGTCLLGGRREECLSTSGVIRAGDAVRVVSVDGMQIKVASGG